MSRRIASVLLVAFVVFTGRAAAVIGTLDDVPAATLLLPYFEVDQTSANGVNTLLTIRNADSNPVVAHLTFWSNLSVPVLDFDLYLTGYDQQSFSLREVLVSGILSTTGPSDALSPRGERSGPHDTFGGSCSTAIGQPPAYLNPAISASFRSHLQAWLRGLASPFFGTCAGAPTGHLVGYVTIDAVNRCALFHPGDPTYFEAGGQGVASNRNVLWGDWILYDLSTRTAQADTLVAIEASATDPSTSAPGAYTFYGRYTGGSAADNRERLVGQWYAPLDSLAGVGDSRELLVWRDVGRPISAFSCNTPPAVFPLGSSEISAIGQGGGVTPLVAGLFPRATQRTAIVPAASWMRLDLDTSTGSVFDPAKQSYVIALRQSPGLPSGTVMSTGMGAVQPRETGVLGTADAAPAASLLLPYFEVDPGSLTGVRTAVAVHNTVPVPVLARVVLWTDHAVPTVGFDLNLPALGSRTVDLRDVFLTGSLPASSPSTSPGCAGVFPLPPLSSPALAALNAAHTGGSSQLFGGLCGGANHADGVARGYLTVDLMNRCTFALPGQAGYFGAGGAVGFENVLWGDYAIAEPARNLAHGDTLVHLQASTTDPLTSAPGRPTFYGRYVGWTAADHREALARGWGAGSRRDGAQPGSASLLVWRDSGQINQPFTCGSALAPLPQEISLHFDSTGQDVPVPPFAFGLEAQKRAVDWTGPNVGSLSLDLGMATGGFTPPFPQAHVTSVEGSPNDFLLGSITGFQLPMTVVFKDGFEIGGPGAWSFAVP